MIDSLNNLNKLDIKTISLPSKTIRDLVHSSPQCNIFSDVYCKNCKKIYWWNISEPSRRLKEHKRDIRIDNYALFQHISQSNYNFDFNSAKMLIYIYHKTLRRIFEAGAISVNL